MVDFFHIFHNNGGSKIYTIIYNLLATGLKALGQCLFQGWCRTTQPTPVL